MPSVFCKNNVLFKCLLLVLFSSFALVTQAQPKVLVLGDSISAGFGIPVQEGWVKLFADKLQQKVATAEVINASVSGETTQGGLTRLPQLLKQHQPSLTIIELGGNDGLRGTPIKVIENNLRQLVQLSLAADSQVLLVGMQIPPNYGARYTELFTNNYQKVAKDLDVPVLPFFLEGVAGVEGMMQADGIHPTAPAQPLLVGLIWPYVIKSLAATGH